MEGPGQTPESVLSLRDLEARITELAGHLNAANHRWLRLIAEFDRRQGWADGCTVARRTKSPNRPASSPGAASSGWCVTPANWR